MASRYAPMVSPMDSDREDTDVAGIPFPAPHCAATLDFPAMPDGDSFLGEVLAFIHSTAERAGASTPAPRA